MEREKCIVVIGASSGIGNRIARIYARRGWKVVICARRMNRLEELQREFPDNVKPHILDVDSAEVASQFETILNSAGNVDIILNCAGIGKYNPELDSMVDINTIRTDCVGFAAIADTAFNYFASSGRKGQIAAISSIAGVRSLSLCLSYSASKRFQNQYLEGLDQLRRIRKAAIDITDIRPGFVATDLLDSDKKYPMTMNPDYVARLAVKAIDKRKRVAVIDWRYKILVFLWRMIPRRLWVRLPIHLSI